MKLRKLMAKDQGKSVAALALYRQLWWGLMLTNVSSFAWQSRAYCDSSRWCIYSSVTSNSLEQELPTSQRPRTTFLAVLPQRATSQNLQPWAWIQHRTKHAFPCTTLRFFDAVIPSKLPARAVQSTYVHSVAFSAFTSTRTSACTYTRTCVAWKCSFAYVLAQTTKRASTQNGNQGRRQRGG